jgi:hypothetical protein
VIYITDRDGNPNVFKVEHNDDGLWLYDGWARPAREWNPDNVFVFRLGKSILFHATVRGFSFYMYLV